MRLPLIIRAWPLLLLLAACAPVGPDYTPPAPDLPARWGTEHGGQPPAATESGDRWWNLFNDPLLNDLLDRAIAANHDLRIAGSRIKAARARYRHGHGLLRPIACRRGLLHPFPAQRQYRLEQ